MKITNKLFVLLIGIGLTQFSYSLTLTPMEATLSPTGKKNTFTFTVFNKGSKPEAVRVYATDRTPNIEGKEQRNSPTNDFIITPEKFILMPSKKKVKNKKTGEIQEILEKSKSVRTITIKWNPKNSKFKKNLKRELAYRFYAEQVPVTLAKTKTNTGKINIVVRYGATVYITPNGAKSNVKIIKKKIDKKRGNLVFKIHNKGTKHQLLKDPKMTVSGFDSKGKKLERQLTKEEMGGLINENVLAGKKRICRVSIPDDFKNRFNKKLKVDVKI